MDDNCLKLSASLSYSTIFALPSLAILLISSVGLFHDSREVSDEFFLQIANLVGEKSAEQIQEVILNMNFDGSNQIAYWVSIGTLLFTASAVFAEIQSSINYIWELKAKPKKGIIRFIINRLLSFAMIGALGFVLLVSLIINTVIDLLSRQLVRLFSENTVYIAQLINVGIVFLIVTIIFSFIFKTLPDGKLKWKDTFIGAAFTSVLFMLGKFIIGNYLVNTAKLDVYGAAGSILVLLLWVYYSAMILYFGAVFTKNYSEQYGTPIEPSNYSVRVIIKTEEVTYAKEKNKSA
ncbi:ribonuclease BN [Capnocytophaga sp. H4358]|uniref:Ribonuclease BN n=2 Tax=Flavobacteriaceae TaxID=49546 RepID=A0A3A1YHH7_9FLAO|nr:ribonuclease BN [Capnocytophaga sp. H4358]ATA76040.1 ribonuclease BN [Capnocytophaga sp. H2931]RIY37061.1 ribonuclease BN [Capnocytophaga canis]